ncbi:uncharacterized protein VTP21DRAFT_4170 [Calcarisporiella thermophila]|uniref:uncharacterized protein n=1 Tax=Calcarisporiella thermophila TaxID=911321 RepID=UPI003742309C
MLFLHTRTPMSPTEYGLLPLDLLLLVTDLICEASTNSPSIHWDESTFSRIFTRFQKVESEAQSLSLEELDKRWEAYKVECVRTNRRVMTKEEILNASQALFRVLISNPHLSQEKWFYVLRTYRKHYPSKRIYQERIAEDFQELSQTFAIGDVMSGIQSFLLNQTTTTIAEHGETEPLLACSYRLSPLTITRRAAARTLLEHFRLEENSIAISRSLKEFATRVPDGIDIIAHALLLTSEYSRDDTLKNHLTSWIFSVARDKSSAQVSSLSEHFWGMHPWLLARLTYFLPPEFSSLYISVLTSDLLATHRAITSATIADAAAYLYHDRLIQLGAPLKKQLPKTSIEKFEGEIERWVTLFLCGESCASRQAVERIMQEWKYTHKPLMENILADKRLPDEVRVRYRRVCTGFEKRIGAVASATEIEMEDKAFVNNS